MKAKATPANKQPKTGSAWGLENARSLKQAKADRLLIQRNATLAKLDLDPADIDRAPQITALLADANVDTDTMIQAMRFSTDPHVVEFLKTYDEASITDRAVLPLEAFAILAEVNITQLLGAMIMALRNQSANLVKMIVTAAHPEVIRASIENALRPGGVKDRNAIHTAMRLLPVSKGATIIMTPPGQLTQGAEAEIEGRDIDTNALFPNLEDTQKLLSE